MCGPSDDLDEQTAVTVGYHHLVIQFKRLAGPVLSPEGASRLDAIDVEFNNIYSAYTARAELETLLPKIELALNRIEDQETMVAQAEPRASLSALFVNHAADVLADTDLGLKGAEIVRTCAAFAIELNVSIPHPVYPFDAPNKRTALAQNLMAFSEPQRYLVIRELCDLPSSKSKNADAARNLKLKLMARCGHLNTQWLQSEVNEDLVMQARHWLDLFPEILQIFNQAIEKYRTRIFVRNWMTCVSPSKNWYRKS
jgi:hypothetical protein